VPSSKDAPPPDLVAALVSSARVLSLIGAGGKKTTMYALAAALPGRVALSSSSHMAAYDSQVVDGVVTLMPGAQELPKLTDKRIVAYGGAADSPERIRGLSFEQLALLAADTSFDVVLIKADGARARWIKAPAAYEPVIAPATQRVLYLLSVQVVGAPLDERIAHRPQHIAAATGAILGAPLTVTHLAALLCSPVGALQGLAQTEVLPIINMVDDETWHRVARDIACLALARTTRFDRIVLANMKAARIVEVITRADL
jgi:probable selenium-dependent hydroxylase accessory protein YqeC